MTNLSIQIDLRLASLLSKPSMYFESLRISGTLESLYPELYALIGMDQSTVYHPEGDAYVHTLQTIDVMATLCDKAGVTGLRRQISVIAMLVHDFGKAITRGVNDKTGQPNYIDHEKLGVPIVEAFANRLGFDEEETHLLAFVTEHHMRMHGLSKMRDVKVLALVEEAKAIDPDLVRLMGDVGRADEWGRMAVYDETSFIKEGKIIPHKEVELWDSYAEIAEGLIGIENEQAKLKQLRLLLK